MIGQSKELIVKEKPAPEEDEEEPMPDEEKEKTAEGEEKGKEEPKVEEKPQPELLLAASLPKVCSLCIYHFVIFA